MRTRLTRRHLLGTSLLGVPLAAACSGDGNTAPETAGEVPAAPSVASPVSAGSDAAVPQPTAAGAVTPTAPGQKTVVLDPGHGGDEIGAASAIAGLPNLLEKDSNLAFGKRLRELLEA
ncbi:MAG: N-acetylmuramoyl-L-alanine amidase, partial [Dehalococcoidia bacterium]